VPHKWLITHIYITRIFTQRNVRIFSWNCLLVYLFFPHLLLSLCNLLIAAFTSRLMSRTWMRINHEYSPKSMCLLIAAFTSRLISRTWMRINHEYSTKPVCEFSCDCVFVSPSFYQFAVFWLPYFWVDSYAKHECVQIMNIHQTTCANFPANHFFLSHRLFITLLSSNRRIHV